ncbi:MAG: DNA-3-methyladenine glycosylase 2 [Verrucomicrobiota bacterium]|jgi:3-methyladenine DNA glycosylase/8-oxoguanine DNA glycosylase
MKPRFPAAAVAQLSKADPVMKALIERVGPYALQRIPADTLFEALLRSIVYQQLHGRAAQTIHGRVLATLAERDGTTPESVAKTTDDALRAAGLSRAKLLAIRDLAAKCLDGTVPTLVEARRLSDEALEQRLTAVRGIGPWTVHMLLIFTLGRPDVLPTGDFAIRLAFRQLYRKRREPSPAVIIRHARCWQPFRSVASWYLWRSLDTNLPIASKSRTTRSS